ncbi:putative peptidoglycan-binding domain-containing protein [Aequorivita sublithincola DSM 14238]|uniref:Putative peptidoglycan-binding domain-containing protein n=1 Tax=Aequorivita sublithincola (strain DSM 14238 / LMG 21431 / ACAM 643 / 9-3) TaxID=746697 RepID=I3YXX4_AEQSU|nr:peptidoglycan-binding domain-containing protein [Aequorivita sublithincola]AFL81842.1 putative peptidoglycan-binding domain-containing protein [Aequorivita sublithincola DSM 14238]
MSTLFLGSCDTGKVPADRKRFLSPYHKDGLTANAVSFRDDDRTTWRSFREGTTKEVAELQQFLYKAGFMPRGVIDGIFDYVTQAAARLFQEYIRTMDPEGDKTMVPDGIVGNGTMQHVQRWKSQGKVADWGKAAINPSKEYNDWIKLLNESKAHYISNPGPIMQAVNSLNKTYSTVKAKDWNVSTDEVHLIGIRRKQDNAAAVSRANDDFFVLLVNGMVFKFWGSTDPNKKMVSVSNAPSLVEGQHKYRFGWHKVSVETKIYRALKPYDPSGVIILRDLNKDSSMTAADLVRGSNSLEVNNSINIHWSGVGSSNWSAGCQVIAGKNYINSRDELVDCSKFASSAYSQLNSNSKMTKGAYNVLADLIVCYSKAGIDHVYYTLGREESLNLDANFGANYAINALKKMNPSVI